METTTIRDLAFRTPVAQPSIAALRGNLLVERVTDEGGIASATSMAHCTSTATSANVFRGNRARSHTARVCPCYDMRSRSPTRVVTSVDRDAEQRAPSNIHADVAVVSPDVVLDAASVHAARDDVVAVPAASPSRGTARRFRPPVGRLSISISSLASTSGG